MEIQRIASFSNGNTGGNPAGVVIAARLPSDQDMQRIAAEVGFSETVFAARQGEGFRTRYFAPQAEVPFCGHATIALGAALGAAFGAGDYPLILNETEILVSADRGERGWEATLLSPSTSYRAVEPDLREAILGLFGWGEGDLDPALEMVRANGGAEHVIVPLAAHQTLKDMAYDQVRGAEIMRAFGLVTINLIWRENAARIYSRNPFAGHGVYEDPATGAAAAALAGYLRDSGTNGAPFEVVQGVEMGAPSKLFVSALEGRGASIQIRGATRIMQDT